MRGQHAGTLEPIYHRPCDGDNQHQRGDEHPPEHAMHGLEELGVVQIHTERPCDEAREGDGAREDCQDGAGD